MYIMPLYSFMFILIAISCLIVNATLVIVKHHLENLVIGLKTFSSHLNIISLFVSIFFAQHFLSLKLVLCLIISQTGIFVSFSIRPVPVLYSTLRLVPLSPNLIDWYKFFSLLLNWFWYFTLLLDWFWCFNLLLC